MARDIKIFFRSREGAASAKAILLEAGCGRDVAVIKDPYARPEKEKLTDEQAEMLAELMTGLSAAGGTFELLDAEEQHPARQVDEVTVTLRANDPRLPALITILDRNGIPWLDEGLSGVAGA